MTHSINDTQERINETVKRELCATVRLNLMMDGIWLSDTQLVALVDALATRLEGKWRVRQLQPTRTGPVGGSA